VVPLFDVDPVDPPFAHVPLLPDVPVFRLLPEVPVLNEALLHTVFGLFGS